MAAFDPFVGGLLAGSTKVSGAKILRDKLEDGGTDEDGNA